MIYPANPNVRFGNKDSVPKDHPHNNKDGSTPRLSHRHPLFQVKRPRLLQEGPYVNLLYFDKFCYNSKFIKKNESSPFKIGKPTNRVFSKNYNNPAFSSSFCTRRDTAYFFTSLAGRRINFSGTGKEGGSVTFRKSA